MAKSATKPKKPKPPSLGALSREYKPKVRDLRDAAERAPKILTKLRRRYPNANTALEHEGPLQLLIMTILSAQCTDERVNMVAPVLFERYQAAKDFAQAKVAELQDIIRSTGFYRNKAQNIKGACQAIVAEHGGKVPDDIEALVALPGVGRKTANCVLGNAFGKPALVTDTHVIRLSRLLGLSKNKDAVKLEYDLMELFPKRSWTKLSHMLILHGRQICIAGRPQCAKCSLQDVCCFGMTVYFRTFSR